MFCMKVINRNLDIPVHLNGMLWHWETILWLDLRHSTALYYEWRSGSYIIFCVCS